MQLGNLMYQSEKVIGLIEIFQNIGMLLECYFFLKLSFDFCIFLVRGIVDKINEITNAKVMPTRLQNVILESSNSPKEIVMNKFNFN